MTAAPGQPSGPGRPVRRAGIADLDARTLHDLIALRVAVFVVEQNCPYEELDGRDTEPATEHLWTADEHGPTAYLRVLSEPDGVLRIGRVCTRADARGQGLAGRLLTDVLDRSPGRVLVLGAQAHLADWYARYGFRPDGPGYDEDGIPHVPMRRP